MRRGLNPTLPNAFAALLVAAVLASACEPAPAVPEEEPSQDLPALMMFMQRYAEKLHMAGQEGNWELAAFYVHELEETGEALRDGGYEARGLSLTSLADTSFLPAVREVDRAIDVDPQAFDASFRRLAASCNTCHQASGYGFLRIVVPEEARPFPSQQFRR
jgi:hypothetical protein